MLRTYFVQQWFSLFDPGVEETLYGSPALQMNAVLELAGELEVVKATEHHLEDLNAGMGRI